MDALGPAGTVGFAAGGCGGAQYGAVAGDNEVVEIAHPPFLDGRDDGDPDEEVFAAWGIHLLSFKNACYRATFLTREGNPPVAFYGGIIRVGRQRVEEDAERMDEKGSVLA